MKGYQATNLEIGVEVPGGSPPEEGMHWNYRLVRKKVRDESILGIYEAHYNDHGHVWGISMEAERVETEGGEKALHRVYVQMAEAFRKPILEYEKIGHSKCPRCIAFQAEMKKQVEEAIPLRP